MEPEVEFKGQAERQVEGASWRHRPGSRAGDATDGVVSLDPSGRVGRFGRQCKLHTVRKAAPKGFARDESRRLDSKAQPEGD